METIHTAFKQSLSLLDNRNTSIVVAYSGGKDSSVLLHLVKTFCTPEFNVKALHVNHQLSENADAWQAHCRAQCDELDIDFLALEISIDKSSGKGLEAAAREARYRALIDNTDDKSVILLGQHEDDQAETFLLQLMRSAGPKGLSAMPVLRNYKSRQFLRPLLSVSRQDIDNYAQEQKLTWVDDESNQSLDFDRNFLRHQVIPKFKQRWDNCNAAIAKSALRCAQESSVLNDYMQLLQAQLLDCDDNILIEQFKCLSIDSQYAFIRHWCDYKQMPPLSSNKIAQILSFLSVKEDAQPKVQNGDLYISRFNGVICSYPCYWEQKSSQTYKLKDFPAEIANSKFMLSLNNHAHVKSEIVYLENITELKVEYANSQALFKPESNRPTKILKQWFKEWKIEPWKRMHIPLIYNGDTLIAVVLDKPIIDCRYKKATEDSVAIYLSESA